MTRLAIAALTFPLLLAPLSAEARDTERFYSAEEAAQSEIGRARLYGTPFYLKGQQHPKVAKTLVEVTTDQSSRGVFRSDKASCEIAFLSAIRVLQREAQEKSGDAIVDIVSITRGRQTESPTDFRCIAGATVVHVGLKGTIVKLGE